MLLKYLNLPKKSAKCRNEIVSGGKAATDEMRSISGLRMYALPDAPKDLGVSPGNTGR